MKTRFIAPVCMICMMSVEVWAHQDKSRSLDDHKSKGVNRMRDLQGEQNTILKGKKLILDRDSVEEIQATVDEISGLVKQITASDLAEHEEWYKELQDWTVRLESTTENKSSEELLNLMEFAMRFTKFYFGRTDINETVLTIVYYMYHLGPSVTRVLAEHVKIRNGFIDESFTDFALEFFSQDNFHGSSLWPEDELPVLDSPGLLIAVFDQQNLLGKYGLERLSGLTSMTSAEAYFNDYFTNGDGMAVLKAKFSKNREQIEELYQQIVDYKKKKRDYD